MATAASRWGSEMSGSVRNVFAFDCDLTGDTALRIKTLPGRGGEIRNIHYDTMRITAHNLALEVTTKLPSPTVTASELHAGDPAADPGHERPVLTITSRDRSSALRAQYKVGKGAAIYIEGVASDMYCGCPTTASPAHRSPAAGAESATCT